MITLEKLRTKGGVIVAVAIAFALIAFILGDILTSGSSLFSSKQDGVGELKGDPLTFNEYNFEIERQEQLAVVQGTAMTEDMQEGIRDRAFQTVVKDKIFANISQATGLDVTLAEQRDMLTGRFISPVVLNSFRNPQTGQFDPSQVIGFSSNVDADETGKNAILWDYLERESKAERMESKYYTLISKGYFITDIEKEIATKSGENQYAVSVISKSVTSVKDSLVTASEDEIKTYYESHKNMFKTTPSKSFSYIKIPLEPSNKDIEEANIEVNEISKIFKTSTELFLTASQYSVTPVNKTYFSRGELPAELDSFAFSAKKEDMFGPYNEDNTISLARIVDDKILPDSVKARHIYLALGTGGFTAANVTADSIINAIKGGESFDSLLVQYSANKENGGDLGWLKSSNLNPDFMPVMEASVGSYNKVEVSNGVLVVQTQQKSAMSRKVQLAVINYEIEPSEETEANLYNKATDIIALVANDKSDINKVVTFKRVATEARTGEIKDVLYETSSRLSTLSSAESRDILTFVHNSKKEGEISSAIMTLSAVYVAVVTEITTDKYQPLALVTDEIKTMVLKDKKIELLKKEMGAVASKTLDAIALELDIPITEIASLKNTTTYIQELKTVEPAIAGALSVMKDGDQSKVVEGEYGVYILKLKAATKDPLFSPFQYMRTTANANTSRVQNGVMVELQNEYNVKDFRNKIATR